MLALCLSKPECANSICAEFTGERKKKLGYDLLGGKPQVLCLSEW